MIGLFDLIFLWRIAKARGRELSGQLPAALRQVEASRPSRHYEALRDAYRARLIALEGGPAAGIREIDRLRAARWYANPANDAELYTRAYCEYLKWALLGNSLERDRKKLELRSFDVAPVYKGALLVT